MPNRTGRIASATTTASVLLKCSVRRKAYCAPLNNYTGFFMRRAFCADSIDWDMPIFDDGNSMGKRRWLAIPPLFGSMVMRSQWNTKRRRSLNIPFAINQIKSTSKQCQRPDDLKPLIALCKDTFGNWMKGCGSWLHDSLSTLLGGNDEESQHL